MMDYNEKHWDNPCPRIRANQHNNCHGLKAIFIPASLADEMTPANGAFSNAIVKYENTGEIWIYDVDGVPVKIKEENADTEDNA